MGSESYVSFVSRSPVFKGNVDTVDEFNITHNHFSKTMDNDSKGIIKRKNTHMLTIMSKFSNSNIEECSISKNFNSPEKKN